MSVARPQANGQMEAVNKMIKHNLKTKLKDLKERWANELPKVLGDHRQDDNWRNPILACLWLRGDDLFNT